MSKMKAVTHHICDKTVLNVSLTHTFDLAGVNRLQPLYRFIQFVAI